MSARTKPIFGKGECIFGDDRDIGLCHVNVIHYDKYGPTSRYAFGKLWPDRASADVAVTLRTAYRVVVKPKRVSA